MKNISFKLNYTAQYKKVNGFYMVHLFEKAARNKLTIKNIY